MKRVSRIDPWMELAWTARAALAGHVSVAAASEVAWLCGYPMGEGALKPHAQTLNALRLLVLAWRDVPTDARKGVDAAILGLLDAIDAWPAHLAVPADDLAAQRRERAIVRKTTRRPGAGDAVIPYYLRDDLRD